MSYAVAWRFRTARFTVELRVHEEPGAPEDYFGFQEDVDAVRRGDTTWFAAQVAVLLDGRNVGDDWLGCCAYKSVEDFYTSHRDPNPMNRNCSLMRAAKGQNVSICHYFPDMVRQAVSAARATLNHVPKLRHVA